MNMTWTHLKPLYPQKEHVLQVRRPKHILEKIHNGGYAREELIYEGFCKCRWDTPPASRWNLVKVIITHSLEVSTTTAM